MRKTQHRSEHSCEHAEKVLSDCRRHCLGVSRRVRRLDDSRDGDCGTPARFTIACSKDVRTSEMEEQSLIASCSHTYLGNYDVFLKIMKN